MQPDDDDLAELLAAIGRHDRRAFSRVYDLTAGKLLAVSLRILRDRSRAEDVVQDVFLRVWQSAGSYSAESGRPMTWLITIARNRAIDVVRQRRTTVTPLDENGRDIVAAIPDPRFASATAEDLSRLRVCLGQLDDTHRRCILEAYYEGFSREELATRYDKPVNTIKTWLHRSATALRACLGGR